MKLQLLQNSCLFICNNLQKRQEEEKRQLFINPLFRLWKVDYVLNGPLIAICLAETEINKSIIIIIIIIILIIIIMYVINYDDFIATAYGSELAIGRYFLLLSKRIAFGHEG